MAEYGLSESGFLTQPLTVIRDELNAALRAAFGNSIDLGDRSIFGQIVGILAERYALLWELAEAVYSSQDPDKATGTSLESICTLTGTFRPDAEFSVVTLTLTGTPTTVVAAGKRVSTTSTSQVFVTRQNATIDTLSAWVISTAYLVGARVTNSGNAYECITAGTSAGSGGPTTTAASIPDGSDTLVWTYLGLGTGAIDVGADANETGAVTALARDITTKVDAVSGWESVINLEDANPGREAATDQELRLLRELELSQAGTSTVDAIRAALVAVDDVVSVTMFVNDTDTTNADGMPPHSIEALVRPPSVVPSDFNQNVWDTLLANVAAGIQTTASGGGAQVGTATDSEGTVHAVSYSRPAEIPIYVTITVTYDAALYPADGDAQIEAAIVAFGDAQNTGKDAVSSSIGAQAFDVNGVLDVVTCFIGTAPAPGASTTIAISLRQLATYDTGRITVASSPATP